MTPRVTAYIAAALAAACISDLAGPAFVFEGTITSVTEAGGAGSVPGIRVETHPGSSTDALCSNVAIFYLHDVELVAYVNGRLAGVDDLAVGQRVRVRWDGSQLDSCPPKRGADIITILS